MHILLVDDEKQCAAAVARGLREDYRHQVTLAANPVEAVQALKLASFDVVINDVLYTQQGDIRDDQSGAKDRRANPEPVKSGLWTIRHIKTHHPKIGIVVWTVGDSERRLHLRYAVSIRLCGVAVGQPSRAMGGKQSRGLRCVTFWDVR